MKDGFHNGLDNGSNPFLVRRKSENDNTDSTYYPGTQRNGNY